MRCFFMFQGHITGVEILIVKSDEEAIARAHVLFSQHLEQPQTLPFDGFEVWDRERYLYRYPATAEPSASN